MNCSTKRAIGLTLVATLLGCSNKFDTEIERWNIVFAGYQQGCLLGNSEMCQLACGMTREMALCKKVSSFVDPGNQMGGDLVKRQYDLMISES